MKQFLLILFLLVSIYVEAQQAIKTVCQHALEWKLDAERIGIMGFSAGGHLASTAGTHFNKSYIPNAENVSLLKTTLNLYQ